MKLSEMLKFKLYDYQNNGVCFAYKHHYCLIGDEMGVGKSIQAISVALLTGRTLVVCPASLKMNWENEFNKFCVKPLKIHRFKKLKEILTFDESVDVAIINYEMVEKCEKLFGWARIIIADECFKYGTLVDTPHGKIPINELKVGGKVINAIGVGRVRHIRKTCPQRYLKISFGNREISVTGNHPLFTNRGWVRAEDLKKGDYLVRSNKILQVLWEKIQKSSIPFYRENLHVLFSQLWNEMEGGKSKDEGLFTKSKLYEEKKYSGESEEKIDRVGSAPPSEGREWAPSYSSRDNYNEENTRIGMELCSENEEEKWKRIPPELQNRFGLPQIEVGDRSGRSVPRFDIKEDARQKKGEVSIFVRVEDIEIQEQGDIGEREESYFYNLEVSGHPSYSVEGVLVHNCHYLKNIRALRTKSFHNAIEKHKPYRFIGLSGTTIKNRVGEFYSPLAICSYNPIKTSGEDIRKSFRSYTSFCENFSYPLEMEFGGRKVFKYYGVRNIPRLKELLVGKYIRREQKDVIELPELIRVPIIYDLKTDDKLANAWAEYEVHKKISESISSAKQASAMAKIEYTVEKVEEVLEENPEKQVIVFSEHILSVEKIIEQLNAKGIKADGFTGSVLIPKRDKIINDFNEGKIRVLVMTIITGGLGLNLTTSSVIIFNDLSWVPSDNWQAEKRIHRIGQKERCMIYYIVGGEVDKMIQQTITSKISTLKAVL